ncbi:tetratricopeptide repeat protein [Aliikangiella marina]|uniref:Tetratricopeptide repeat protein n=1 Tax=Aliikangiella marina TaxID=1712262 RepID=A0A545TGS1_9GAMM|nr:tetratricopeptide repeat protein [Aliikangiella marina]TQV76405.1 tetratricopeptide repeat protein [Aliikangiella marina]
MNEIKSTKLMVLRAALVRLSLITMLILSGCSANKTLTESQASQGTPEKLGPTAQQKEAYNEALTALDKKDYAKAEFILKDLNQSNPELSGPWANLGLIKLIQKKPDEAEKLLTRSLELNPKLTKALNLLGLIAIHDRQLAEAESYFKQAIDIDDTYSNAHYNLALLYDIYLQDINKAALHYRKYSELTQNTDEETLNWLEQLEATLR